MIDSKIFRAVRSIYSPARRRSICVRIFRDRGERFTEFDSESEQLRRAH